MSGTAIHDWMRQAIEIGTTDGRLTRANPMPVRKASKGGVAEMVTDAEPNVEATGAANRHARAVLDELPEPLIVAEPAGRIALLNARAEEAFGYAPAEAVGQPIEQLLPNAVAAGVLLGRRKDGSTFPIALSRQPIELDGRCLEIHLVRDVSDEQDRLRQQEEFFANASHELRAPATTLRASVEVLIDILSPQLSADGRRLLAYIERDAERLSRLIDDLLDINSIQAGRLRLRLVECDLRDVAEGAASAMEPMAYRQGQTLGLELPAQPFRAIVDAEMLGRALLNLVANACKYGRQDGGRVDVRLESGPGQATFTVSDDGPGIPDAERERIFQRFYRAPTADGRRVQGNGLGLALCRAVVEMHGGRVSVDGPSGAGGVFRIVLPVRAHPPQPMERALAQ
jgi:signal transduction histidine kinase